jgi:hydroxyacylglutathione hydrolase
MELHTLRFKDEAFATNRQYIMKHVDQSATVVDPASAEEALAFLEANECNLAAILLTHYHADHTAGVPALLEAYPDCPVVSGDGVQHKIPQVTHILADGHNITIGDTQLTALATPGHTLDHYAFHTNNGVAFVGDCLFRLGCGRLFEGTPDMLWTSLLKLRALPDNTIVCCGHDYVVDNAKFSLQTMSEDAALTAAVQQLITLTEDTRLPFLLGEDKASNLFLRADQPEVMAAVNTTNARDCLAALRRMRDVA